MTLKIINKDILKIESGIIAHQVNMQGKMGAGLALQIAKKWPKAKESYLNHLNRGEHSVKLGQGVLVKVSPDIYVCNLYTQDFYGRGQCHTDYSALGNALHKLYHISTDQLGGNYTIYLPQGLGCGLGGGDWDTVLKIIQSDCPSAIICKL
jgi:O-acetyl-ADP-ribose deacetylase (regulator of RNase III)